MNTDQTHRVGEGVSVSPGLGKIRKYLLVGGILGAFTGVLTTVAEYSPGPAASAQPKALVAPIAALVALTGVAVMLMAGYRNFAFARGWASEQYFKAYTAAAPSEWIERPARLYMNLLELPVLFYVAALLMLVTRKLDATQVSLAWLFVITRWVHAFVYIGFNYVPLRFAAFFSGVLTLGVLWARIAAQAL
jgi:hypothetical protein